MLTCGSCHATWEPVANDYICTCWDCNRHLCSPCVRFWREGAITWKLCRHCHTGRLAKKGIFKSHL